MFKVHYELVKQQPNKCKNFMKCLGKDDWFPKLTGSQLCSQECPLFPPQFGVTHLHSQDPARKIMAELKFALKPRHLATSCWLSHYPLVREPTWTIFIFMLGQLGFRTWHFFWVHQGNPLIGNRKEKHHVYWRCYRQVGESQADHAADLTATI